MKTDGFLNGGGGVYFGQSNPQMPLAEKAWATPSRRGIFILNDGFLDRPRHNKKVPSDGTKRKIAVLSQTINSSFYKNTLLSV